VPLLSQDVFYRALATAQRRRALYVLLVQEAATVDELATVLAGWEATDTGTMRSPADHRRIGVDLRHRDLPMLAEAGLVDYDAEAEVVTVEPLEEAVVALVCRSVEADPGPVESDNGDSAGGGSARDDGSV
jgi:hypothetical protein